MVVPPGLAWRCKACSFFGAKAAFMTSRTRAPPDHPAVRSDPTLPEVHSALCHRDALQEKDVVVLLTIGSLNRR